MSSVYNWGPEDFSRIQYKGFSKMGPILSYDDKRLKKYHLSRGILAKHIKTGKLQVFRLGKLPEFWKSIKIVRLDIKGLTISEAIAVYNKRLANS